ncbi:MAG: helix-turn-helix domain-containing protein [bacterium]|nr:helix-turn-helix domain-containing protein [bacterium]
MQDIAPILRSLGFLESEAKVYLASIELGPSTVIDLAGATRLSRPATYTAVEALRERGIMGTLVVGKRRLFSAEHPDRLLAYAQRKATEVRDRVSDLSRAVQELALRMGGEKPVVKAFEGKEGIQAIIEDVRATRPKTMEEISNIDALRAVVSAEELAPMREELARSGCTIRGLYTGERLKPTSITDARVLPDRLAKFRGNVSIYGNKIALMTFAGKLHSIMIEDAILAETMRTLFEAAWEGAEKFVKKSSS